MEQRYDRRFCVDGNDDVCLVASGLGDASTGGGLFLAREDGVEVLDRLSSTGLYSDGRQIVRALRSHEDSARIELLFYDRHGVARYLRVDGIGDAHDVVQSAQSTIVVCSAHNAVVWLAADGTIVDRVDLPGDGDAWHVNSVHECAGRLYATAFGRYGRSREWAEPGTSRDEGILFDLRTHEPIVRGLSQPHHPRFAGGLWYICNSGQKEVIAVDAASGAIRHRIPCGGFTRGLIFTDEYMLVGVSAPRRGAVGATAGIAVFRLDDWQLVERMSVPVQEIYDLALVPGDLIGSLRAGFGTNTLRVQEQHQYGLFQAVGVAQPRRLWAVGDVLPVEDRTITIVGRTPERVQSDTIFTVDVSLTNDGSAFLVTAPPYPVYFSYKWFAAGQATYPDERPARRTPLPRSLPPGGVATATLTILAPQLAGSYDLRITLVQELIAWFDDSDTRNGWRTTIIVDAPAAPMATNDGLAEGNATAG